MAITSRQNPIVSRFRDAANGDGTSVLLDGAHLVADAIAANAAIALAAVTTVSRAKPEIAAIADSLAQRGVEVTTVGVSVMNAISPVRSPAGIVAIAERPATAAAAVLRVTIPMQPPVESLNAAVTAAVILYEAHRQRQYSLFKRVRY